MKIPANSPYRSSNFIKNRQHESLIRRVMRHPNDSIDTTNQPKLTQRKAIAIIFFRIIHRLKMAFNRSGYRISFIQAAIKIEAARSERQQSLADILVPSQSTTKKSALVPIKPAEIPPANHTEPAPVKPPIPPAEIPPAKHNEVLDLAKTQPIPKGSITTGQGEYIVFHQLENGEIRQPSPETFEKAYQLLLAHKPRTLAQQNMESCENRHALLNAALKSVDPSLQAVFVPKTLYELVFIRKCISEDLKHNSICRGVSREVHQIANGEFKNIIEETKLQQFRKDRAADILKRKCWHICSFDDEGDDQNEGVKKMALRMNKVLLKTLNPTTEGFTFKTIQAFGEKELDFLKAYYKDSLEKEERGEEILRRRNDRNGGGPTTNFIQNDYFPGTDSMAIRDEAVAQIVRNGIALDCSELAKNSLFIFRGSNFEEDCVTKEFVDYDNFDREQEKYVTAIQPYSLSYGTSLFAGCILDGGATAFHYMRREDTDCAYAMSIPFDQVDDSPFFVPQTHTLTQLYGYGEIFHARTKAWAGCPMEKIGGIKGIIAYRRDHLASDFSKEALEAAYKFYKDRAIHMAH